MLHCWQSFMIGEDSSSLEGLIRQCTNFGLPKTLFPYKDALGRGGGGGGETRKSFSLSLEMRVWITVNWKKTMAGEEILTPFFPLSMNFNIPFLNGSLSSCSSSWSTEKNNQFFYQTVRTYLSYLSRNSFKRRRSWETKTRIFLLPSSIFASRTDFTTSPTHWARSDYIPNGQLLKQHKYKFHFSKRPESTEPLRSSTTHKYLAQPTNI